MKKHILYLSTAPPVWYFRTVVNNFFYVCKRKDSSIPYIFFKDPKTKIKLPNARFSADKLNQLISNPVERVDYSTSIYIGYSILQEGLLPKLLEQKSNKKKTDKKAEEKKEDSLFNEFILNFWDYQNSWYLQHAELIKGKKPTESYCNHQLRSYINHCQKYIPKKLKLKEFSIDLMEKIQIGMRKEGFSGKTINEATNSISKPLREAYNRNYIKEDIGNKLSVVYSDTKERGILTEEEGEKLLKHLKNSTAPKTFDRWKYLVCAIAYYTGMRQGEILALQKEDLDTKKNIICVNHSWNRLAKLKAPKNGHTRKTFPISPILMNELVEYSEMNSKSNFVFPAKVKENQPIKVSRINDIFNKALNDIGISEDERKERNIVFHSLRHGFVSNALANGVAFDYVEKGAGHLTKAMTEHYTHETEKAEAKYIEATKQAIKYVE